LPIEAPKFIETCPGLPSKAADGGTISPSGNVSASGAEAQAQTSSSSSGEQNGGSERKNSDVQCPPKLESTTGGGTSAEAGADEPPKEEEEGEAAEEGHDAQADNDFDQLKMVEGMKYLVGFGRNSFGRFSLSCVLEEKTGNEGNLPRQKKKIVGD
jgi:hypothetical protein